MTRSKKQKNKHFSIGVIAVFCNMLFPCGPGSSQKVPGRFLEDNSIFIIIPLLHLFIQECIDPAFW